MTYKIGLKKAATNVIESSDEVIRSANKELFFELYKMADRVFKKVSLIDIEREIPKDFLEALIKMDKTEDGYRLFSKEEIIKYFTDYHNNFNYRFLNDIESILIKNPNISRTDAYTIWGYTTNYYYWYLNAWLRAGVNSERITLISNLLTKAIKKMPRYSGEAYRALDIKGDNLVKFLKEHKVGNTLEYNDFVSCGSNTKAAFFDKSDKNIFLKMNVKNAPVISDYADGIK